MLNRLNRAGWPMAAALAIAAELKARGLAPKREAQLKAQKTSMAK